MKVAFPLVDRKYRRQWRGRRRLWGRGQRWGRVRAESERRARERSPARPGGPGWIPEGSRRVPGGDPGEFPGIPLFPSYPRSLGHFRFRVSRAAPQLRAGTAAMAPALGLGLLLGLLGGLGSATKVLRSLHYLHVAVSEPSLGIPQFMSIGYLDGIPFTRYDSERGRVEPLTQWIKDGAEPGYWDWQTQICVGNQHVYARSLDNLRNWYNQSRGLHTWLRVAGCDLLSDGSVRGSWRYSYNGQDFISFDLESRRFLAADSVAEVSRRRWEEENEAERYTNYLEHVCPEWLQKYVGYGQKELDRKEPPDVHVSGKEEHGMLILSCHAYGFYPNAIAVNWMKGDEIRDQETERGGVVPNSDGTFHTWARIEARPEEREQYRCQVEHPGMSELGIFAWEPTSGGNLTMVVAVSIAAIIILIVIAGFVVWKRQSGKEDRKGYNIADRNGVGAAA